MSGSDKSKRTRAYTGRIARTATPRRDRSKAVKSQVDAARRCGTAIALVYRDGSVVTKVIPCEKWSCPTCAEWRTDKIVEQLKEVTGGGDVFCAEIPPDDWEAARKQAQRKDAGYMGVKRLNGGALLVSDQPLSGRAWSLAPTPRSQVRERILSAPNRRTDWCKRWRLPTDESQNKVIGRIAMSPRHAREVLERAGYDPRLGRIPGVDPYEAAASILEMKAEVDGSAP
jgi:hypothetical protein